MRHLPALAFIALALPLLPPMPAAAAGPAAHDARATASSAVLEDRYPARAVTFPGGVTGLADLTYAVPRGYRPLTLDLYLPPRRMPGPHPVVLYIHGGGWNSGHSRHSGAFENWPGVLASLAAKGYVVGSINYRLSGEAPFPAAIQDVKAAIRYLRSRAADWQIDKSRVLVWGGSAGGQLATLAGTSCGETALQPASGMPQESDCVQGVVAWYPVVDFTALASGTAGNPVLAKYLGCEPSACAAETMRLASPLMQVTASSPPMLLVHGERDRQVPVAQSIAMHSALEKAGVHSELLVIPGVDHSFIGESGEATHSASIAALDRSFAFIDAVIGPHSR